MDISRITKLVVEVSGGDSYDQAVDIRNKDVDLFLPESGEVGLEIMTLSAVALVLRCFTGRLRFHGRASAELQDAIREEAAKLTDLSRLDYSPTGHGQWMLAFGHKKEGAICGDASGWTAKINGTFDTRLPSGCAATFAAACMVAKLFNLAILGRDKDAFEAWDFCLSSFTSDKGAPVRPFEDLHLGRLALLGAGAIGSAVGFVLKISRARAEVVVIDPQAFDAPNVETCILADKVAVNKPRKKAVSLAEALKSAGIDATAEMELINGESELLKQKWNAFVCGVDNSETRRELDHTNARVLLNAGLGDSRDDAGFVLWTKHYSSGLRLSDVYKPTIAATDKAGREDVAPKEFSKDKCSRMAYRDVSLSIPFVALAAGSLLVAGLYHEARGEAPVSNYLQIDLFGKQQRFDRRLRG
jgi:hypothetical protein